MIHRLIKHNFWSNAHLRKPFLMMADFLMFTISYFVAWFLLVRRIALPEHIQIILLGYLFFIVIFMVTFWFFGMYESLWRYAEAYEFLKLMIAAIVAMTIFVVLTFVVFSIFRFNQRISITVYFISPMMSGGLALFLRTAYRAYRETRVSRRVAIKRKKVLVVGAGETGVAVIQSIGRTTGHRYEVVCVVDDDEFKQGRRIQRVIVAGKVEDIPRLVERHGVKVILMAMPHASGKERRRISNICAKTSCELKKVPDVLDFENDETPMTRIEDVSVEDLLGRDVIDVHRFKVKYLAGQTVLITGAGGTIGSELCRQVAAHGASKIVMVDVVENGVYELEHELSPKYAKKLFIEIANVREEERLDWLFKHYKPDLVYHAAAHKHVPTMENSPEEAVKNNILGTLNVARCADFYGVKRFVLISTDKAVNPTNVYGATKRVCEMIVQSMNARSDTEFVAVRFGNVLGSNGSVIPIFKAQIANGGPVRVTHKDIIRYFMTVSEAVSLVMTAGEMAKGGEIFVLDMGSPVKTLDLAEMLIRLAGYEPYKEIAIEFTGLRPGEKLYEELLMDEEGIQTTSNNKIFVGRPINVEPEYLFESINILKQIANSNQRIELVDKLRELVPGFITL